MTSLLWLLGCPHPTPVPFAGSRLVEDELTIAVVDVRDGSPSGLVAEVAAGSPDLVVVTGGDRRTDWARWAAIAPLVGLPRDGEDPRKHAERFEGIGRPGIPGPYGLVDLESAGQAWRMLYLVGASGDVGDEQGYWLPGALVGVPLLVVSDAGGLREEPVIETHTLPLELAVWVAPSDRPLFPNGPYGPMHLQSVPDAVRWVVIDGHTVHVRWIEDGRLVRYRRNRMGWKPGD
ncbi:MAG: hypothetical protein H6736_01945 [Alphaproteobacteria bacterium]|nr:hypothetical protein [Alphaproteobacteria bacterium]MCB9690554.1 hypothetical protein [Alphaproteobacteria bacterium]